MYHFLPNLFEILVLSIFSTILYIVCCFPHCQFYFCAQGEALFTLLCADIGPWNWPEWVFMLNGFHLG